MSLGGDLALAKRKMARQTIWTELRVNYVNWLKAFPVLN